MKVLGASLVAAIAVLGCGPAPIQRTTDPASPLPSVEKGEPHASSLSSAAPPTAAALPTPEATLFGEFPGPAATLPPGQPVIDDLRFEDMAALWALLGLSCYSHASGGPESASSHNVHCEGRDPAANTMVVAEADYWTFEAVATMSVTVGSITMGGSVDHHATATQWVFPFAALAGGDPAVAWVTSHLDDPACGRGCVIPIGNADLSYYNGPLGSHQLYLVVRIPAGSS